jgi:hypothetical protein
MQVTVFGLILMPLCVAFAYNPVRLLQVAFLAAPFEAAAALVLGGFGLQPAMVPGLLFLMYVTTQYALGMRYPGEGRAFRALLPLAALLLYAIVSAWILPDSFAGSVMVEPQKRDPAAPDLFVPLQFSSGNVTQTLYLALNVVCALVTAAFATRAEIPYRRIIAAYLLSGYVVAGLALWQFASKFTGIPFPDDVLQSNPGFAIVSQDLGAVPRIQGPFSEPAGLASYMCGIAFCSLWLSVRGYRTMRPNILFGLALFIVLLSTSTTGIVIAAVGLPITLAVGSVGGDPRALANIGKTIGMLALVGVVVVAPALILRPSLMDSINTIVDSTLNKTSSDSYEERQASDDGAMALIAPTYGLGVGWGSYRSSSFLPGLLANAGVFGVVMLLWQAARLYTLRKRVVFRSHPGQVLVDGFLASLCAQLGTALLSAPMINSLAFFLQLGCVVGTQLRMSMDHPRSRVTVHSTAAS